MEIVELYMAQEKGETDCESCEHILPLGQDLDLGVSHTDLQAAEYIPVEGVVNSLQAGVKCETAHKDSGRETQGTIAHANEEKSVCRDCEDKISVAELYGIWVKVQAHLKPKTKARYGEIFERHILPRFGDCYAEEITQGELGEWLAELAACGNTKNGKGLAGSSVRQIVSAFRSLVAYGLRTKLIVNDSLAGITVQGVQERKIATFTAAEQRKIESFVLQANNPKLYGIIIALYTGLRIGERLALSWQDIDLKKRTIDVSKTSAAVKVNGKYTVLLCPPKSESGKRVVPFPKALLPLLKEMKANGGKYLFTGRNGQPLAVRTYQAAFAGLLKKLNIKHKGFHSLRHTFATRAVMCGADIRTLSEILGHSDPSLTLRRYAHSNMTTKNRLIEKIGRTINYT